MHVTAYLFYNGNCAEALAFYEKAIGAKIDYCNTYGSSPAAEHLPAEMKGLIINAAFRIGDSLLMASDARPDLWKGAPQGFAICINTASVEEAEKVYTGLLDGAQEIRMPLGSTFFAERFGYVIDKFGVAWMIIFEKAQG